MSPFIVVVIATFRRAPELERLFRSLAGQGVAMAVLVVDNGSDPATEAVVQAASEGLEVVRLTPGENLGCGGGLAFGERAAMERFGDRFTHLWAIDDDTEVEPGAVLRLLEAMQAERAGIACPMITWPDGHIGWFPGLLEPEAFWIVRTVRLPQDYVERCGSRPVRFSWSTGVSLLGTREALPVCGVHRDDFWIRGEDLEWSLRIALRFPGIFVPDAVVRHWPRPVEDSPEARAAELKKHGALLQNTAYIATRLPHGHRILRHMPGNLWRFMKAWGWGRGLVEGIRLYWRGAVGGEPAGVRR